MKLPLSRLKRWFWLSLLCLVCLLVTSPGLTLQVADIPNPRQQANGWVTDLAELLKPETIAQLNQIITDLEAKNSAEMAVVTVPDTKPASSPKAFATDLFNHWGIGKKGLNNGVLLLVSKNERRVEIETGYGLQATLPDTRVEQLIRKRIIPRFKVEDYDGGILAGVRSLVQILSEEYRASASPQPAASIVETPVLAVPDLLTVVVVLVKWVGVVLTPIQDWLGWVLLGLGLVGIGVMYWEEAAPDRLVTVLPPQGRFHVSSLNDTPVRQPSQRGGYLFCFRLGIVSLTALLVGLLTLVSRVIWGWQLTSNLFWLILAVLFSVFPAALLTLWLYDASIKHCKRRPSISRYQCAQCQRPLRSLTPQQSRRHLTKPEKLAERLGSLQVKGWQCLWCQLKSFSRQVHLRLVEVEQPGLEACPTCKLATLKASPLNVVVEPSWYRNGIGVIVKECQCCHHQEGVETRIPRLAPAEILFLEPGECSRSDKTDESQAHCARCGTELQSQVLSASEVSDRVSPVEKVAIKIRSLKAVRWSCPKCQEQTHIRLLPSGRKPIKANSEAESVRFAECPVCQELTATTTAKPLQAATQAKPGQNRISLHCHCCHYQHSSIEIVPPIRLSDHGSDRSGDPSDSPNSASDSSSSYSDGSSYSDSSSSWSDSGSSYSDSSSSWSDSGSFSDSGSSWGSSDFGGGSSGGGGAGDNW